MPASAPPLPSTTVVTVGKIGPAVAVSALTLTGIRSAHFNLSGPNNCTLKITNTGGVVTDFDIAATATVTMTIASGVATLTINQ